MRHHRDFRAGQIYGVTQRGNHGQWVAREEEDFLKWLGLMEKYAGVHGVRIHGWCLMHNHGHWLFEASTPESISNLMRDMQGCFSRYLNKKYADAPELLLSPLEWPGRRGDFTGYLRAGPVNWTPRFDALHLDLRGFKSFLRYVELNPVRAGLVRRAMDWKWSSARAHCFGDAPSGVSGSGVLCLAVWEHLFGNPLLAAAAWATFLEGPVVEAALNTRRGLGSYNRPRGWVKPEAGLGAGSSVG